MCFKKSFRTVKILEQKKDTCANSWSNYLYNSFIFFPPSAERLIQSRVLEWKHSVRSKLEIDGSILEQVRQFNYLGCELSLDSETDFDKTNKNKDSKEYAALLGNT